MDGSAPALRGSISTASRSARENALNCASTTWCASGRPYVVHDEPALAPYIGPVYPTSMTRHIFESFGFAAKVTLHVSELRAARDGGHPDAHHVVEAQFKAFSRALREAVEIDPRNAGALPSTKGVL